MSLIVAIIPEKLVVAIKRCLKKHTNTLFPIKISEKASFFGKSYKN